jgi:hypothetical protein
MFTIEYKTEDNAPWKNNGEEYSTKEKALQDALDWLEDDYIVRIIEL